MTSGESGGSWNNVLEEAKQAGSTQDILRRKYIARLHEVRKGRNLIVYYSGWLQKPHLANEAMINVGIHDGDKNGFMSMIKGMDTDKGLDLVLHTPGGDMAATESIVDYLRSKFGTDISAFIPQLAMSGGTMIACACKEIWMGRQSSLGPTDPQMGGLPATKIIEEFARAAKEIAADSSRALAWQPILSKLQPSALTQCEDVVAWSKELVERWLSTGMLSGEADPTAAARNAVDDLNSKDKNRAHNRHLSADVAESYGLKIKRLEDDQELQDAVLNLHHSCLITLEATPAYKIIQNHANAAFIQMARTQLALGQ